MKCENCGYGSKEFRSDLSMRELVDTNEKAFSCPVCGFVYVYGE